MATISELLARAAALRDETAINSIDPNRAGGIMYDTLLCLNTLWVASGSSLVISKIYASVAAMQADTAPVSDLTGKALRPGQIVVIASSDADNGSVYRYDGPSAWSAVGKIGNLPVIDSLDSDSATTPLAAHQGKVLDGKISQLGQDAIKNYILSESFTVVSATYNSEGIVSSASVKWPDGTTGTISVTRDSDGNATQVVATQGQDTYTLSITRNSSGQVTATSIVKS